MENKIKLTTVNAPKSRSDRPEIRLSLQVKVAVDMDGVAGIDAL